ncbi:Pleiotropic drug resistance protein 1 [Vitis vinifera]|uniref:Pleiotropic drug resistance protein 1 n=1 Tax=Vitis vinifera TaxID=29760 RepID=A0A438HIZ2_VITVI|nr:Pleiotropic drug resistance protein 1 [Vitis vinifera]
MLRSLPKRTMDIDGSDGRGVSPLRSAMASAEITRTGASLRRTGSRFWTSSGREVFSRSARDEDDEEALKWAVIQKLPTYNRLKKGLLKGSEGDFSEVDIQNLGSRENKNLLERLVKTAILKVHHDFLHNQTSFYDFLIMGFRVASIFFRVGIVLPEVEVTGKVTYNGHGMEEFVPQRTAAYIGQHDNHIGEMTVRETLAFSARCQGVGFRYEMLAELARREKEANIKPDPDIDGIEGVRQIEDGYNPATWMLEVSTAAQEVTMGVDFNELYKNSDLYRSSISLVDTPAHLDSMYGMLMETTPVILAQHIVHCSEIYLHTCHILDVWDNVLEAGQQMVKQGRPTPTKLSNAMGSMYAAVIFIGLQNSASVQPVVDVERTVFYRELAAGMYSALAYAFSQAIVEIPYIFSQTVLYGVLAYAMISFNGQPPSSSGISSTCSSPCSTSPTPA